ncbi:hypothetical protein G3920_01440 [Neisseria meningitidis]|uniref:hypothetical protein n=1 Tax=Neisseria meningitidis TaxID=487 RepID=UPI0007666CB7|nr:hypothetical protein [Neisseria meningitidis]MBJ1789054.1 hypothetical protein [Neisseria meningitidis]CWM70259.1 putative phage associated protein [Neisseria meningitidis]CWQ58151.1 putative phage associated protein [Neisseria meningitidis]
MTEMVKLQAPEGFTDVSFGSQSYEVDENGVVEVPVEAAQFLYQFGFGNVAEEPAEAEEPEKGKRGRKKAEQPAEAVEPVEAEQAEQPAEAEKTE